MIESIKWYKKAAEKGYPTAQYQLGLIYYNGDGVPRNDAEAVKYFTMASQNKELIKDALSSAYTYLAQCYRFGRGVAADERKADEYTSKAAELGDPDARKIQEFLNIKR